jgi:hypothetical protein
MDMANVKQTYALWFGLTGEEKCLDSSVWIHTYKSINCNIIVYLEP